MSLSSNLTLGLAILGGVVLAGVVAHGAWTTRTKAPKVMRTGFAEDDSPELTRPQIEPGLEDAFDNLSSEPLGPVGKSNKSDSSISGLMPLVSVAPAERKPPLDVLIDSLAKLEVDDAVSGEAAISHLPPTRRVGSKPFAIEGYNAETAQWESLHPGREYSAFQAGVQLANRAGALNDIEFSEFVQKTQRFADGVGAMPQFGDMRHEVLRARELDTFASTHDAQLSITLRARSAAWSPGFVQQSASRQGFVAGAVAGRLVLPGHDDNAASLLTLSFDTQAALSDDPGNNLLRAVNLALDVPQVPRSEQAFVKMRDVAINLAASMDGQITDDHGRVITSDALDAIGSDLEQLYDALDERDLSAGSSQARRLFS